MASAMKTSSKKDDVKKQPETLIPQKRRILINVKVPGRVENPARVIEMLGGKEKLVETIKSIDQQTLQFMKH